MITRDVDRRGAALVERARKHPSLDGRDLVREVTAASSLRLGRAGLGRHRRRCRQRAAAEPPPERYHVVAYDFGIKRDILRRLRSTRLPRHASCRRRRRRDDVLALQPGRRLPVERPGRSGGGRLRGRVGARADRARSCRSSASASGHQILGLALGGEDLQAQVRPPRREPPGDGSRHAQGRDHLAEPRLRRRRRFAAGAGRAVARQPERQARSRACATASCPSSACSTTPRRRRGPTTPATCSIASAR